MIDASSVVQQNVELRLLRYVIAVAEELHFGRAARCLHLSAPALSKQIKDLERNLGYALFWRRTREVLLTPAGVAFVFEARHALERVQRAVECGYAASRGDTGVLSIGYSPWLRPSMLVALQTAIAQRAPNTRLVLHSAYSTAQIDMVLKGTLHAAIIELPSYREDLETRNVWNDELVVALPEKHPLASCSEIDVQWLANEPIIWVTKSLNPGLYRHLLESCEQLGYVPRIAYEVNSVLELLDLVAVKAGIGFVKRSVADRSLEPGVEFRKISGPGLFIETGVAYRADNQSEALRMLVHLLTEQSN